MSNDSNADVATKTKDLIVERIFDAPRELVWKVWTEAEHLKHWWGPADYTAPEIQVDLEVGGSYLWCMESADGHQNWISGVYQEITPPERLVLTQYMADEHGNILSPAEVGLPEDFLAEQILTVTLEALGDKTRMTIVQSGLFDPEILKGATMGWNGSFDKFAARLSELQA